MAKTSETPQIDTPAKRLRLIPRPAPYCRRISGGRGGVYLGYRRPRRGSGVWCAKLVVDGKRIEGRIVEADDTANPEALGYRDAVAAAIEWAARQHVALGAEGARAHRAKRVVKTVRTAIETYITKREKAGPRGRDARNQLTK